MWMIFVCIYDIIIIFAHFDEYVSRPSTAMQVVMRKESMHMGNGLMLRLLHQSIRRHGQFAGASTQLNAEHFLFAFVIAAHYDAMDAQLVNKLQNFIKLIRDITALVENMVLCAPAIPSPSLTQRFQKTLQMFLADYEKLKSKLHFERGEDLLLEVWSILSKPTYLNDESRNYFQKTACSMELQYLLGTNFQMFKTLREGFLSGSKTFVPTLTLGGPQLHVIQHELLLDPMFEADKHNPEFRIVMFYKSIYSQTQRKHFGSHWKLIFKHSLFHA